MAAGNSRNTSRLCDFARSVAMWTCVLTACCATSHSFASEYVQIALPNQVVPNLTVEIALIAEPEKKITQSGDTILSLVNAKCGSIAPAYYSILRLSNASLASLALDRELPVGIEIELPACARGPEPRRVSLKPGETVSTFLPAAVVPTGTVKISAAIQAASTMRFAPADLSTTRLPNGEVGIRLPVSSLVRGQAQAVARAQNFAVIASELGRVAGIQQPANTSVSPDFVPAGAPIVLPAQAPVSQTLKLRATIPIADAIARFRRAEAFDGVTSVATPTEVANIPSPSGALDRGCSTTPTADWPFSGLALMNALQENSLERRRKGWPDAQPSTVLVLDTGFDLWEKSSLFPAIAFPNIAAFPRLSALMSPQDPVTNFGLNLPMRANSARTLKAYSSGARELRWHGSAVISALLGTRILEGYARPDIFPRVIPVSSVDYSAREPFSTKESLREAYSRAAASGASVINYSFSMANDPGIGDVLARYGENIVLVTAAGNYSSPAIDAFPAQLGGSRENSPNAVIITVGGHEPSGERWSLSNHSNFRVDLLAPGCAIGVYEATLNDSSEIAPAARLVSGTSFAAPIVSMVAAILRSEGMTALDVKQRINTSVTLTRDGIGSTFSGGNLNIEQALSIYWDVLRFTDSDGNVRVIKGVLGPLQSTIEICGMTMTLDQIHKFAPYSTDLGTEVRLWYREREDLPLRRANRCLMSEAVFDVNFKSQNGEVVTLSSERIIDYTRRWAAREF